MKPQVYLLVLWNRVERTRQVGRLGRVRFKPGFYVYVGSGGVNTLKRIRRHMRADKPLRWHIDCLTTGPHRMRILDALVFRRRTECALANSVGRMLPAVMGFGASDCRCESHLFHARDIEELRRTTEMLPADGAVRY